MKTKLTSVTYLGFTAMDRRFSNAMLPWLLREIRATGIADKLSIAIEDGCLKAFNGNFEPVIVHRLVDIVRASQVPGRPEELFYILLNEKESLLNCYLFQAGTDNEVHRKHLFTKKDRQLEHIPPTEDALHQHLKRAVYQGVFVWGQTAAQQNLPSRKDWGCGWQKVDNVWVPNWTTAPVVARACLELVRCKCKQQYGNRCSCKKQGMNCTELCICSGKCFL